MELKAQHLIENDQMFEATLLDVDTRKLLWHIQQNKVKIRVMFTQNIFIANNLLTITTIIYSFCKYDRWSNCVVRNLPKSKKDILPCGRRGCSIREPDRLERNAAC